MRTVDLAEVTAKIREMAIESNYNVDPAYVARLEEAKAAESSPLGLRVLNQLTENAALDTARDAATSGAADPLAAATRLAARRPDAPGPHRAAALELVTAGRKFTAKLGLATEDGLLAVGGAVEQATSGRVATWHAQRIPEGLRVLEIGCGCGGDTLALAHRAGNLIACDTDPVRAACAAHNLMALGQIQARAVPGDGLSLLAGEERRELTLEKVEEKPHLMEGATNPDGTPGACSGRILRFTSTGRQWVSVPKPT